MNSSLTGVCACACMLCVPQANHSSAATLPLTMIMMLNNNRDPDAFAVVLNFYRTQKLIIPPGVPEDLVLEELKYFQLPLKEEEQGHVFTWGGGPFGTYQACVHQCSGDDGCCCNNLNVGALAGQLGHGDRRTLMLPQPVEVSQAHTVPGSDSLRDCSSSTHQALQNKHIIQVSLGTSHSAALSDTGVVFT